MGHVTTAIIFIMIDIHFFHSSYTYLKLCTYVNRQLIMFLVCRSAYYDNVSVSSTEVLYVKPLS